MENRGSKDDKVPRRMWQVVETSTRKIGVEEAEKEEAKKEAGKKREEKEKKKKQKKGKTMEVKKVAKEWEIWDEKEEVARSEEEAKKMVLEKFHP